MARPPLARYLVLRNFMTPAETESLRAATDQIEAHANAHIAAEVGGTPAPPHKMAPWGRGQTSPGR